MIDCLFCSIAEKKIPAKIIYEDERVVSFMDIAPANSGHLLVVPKMHYQDIEDIPDNALQELIIRVKKMAKVLGKISQGVNIVQNNKKAAGQAVDHVHFHVIPRYETDTLQFWKSGKYGSEDDMDKIANKLKNIISEMN
ncbi:MAG: HIT family protein [Nanoarchaeota archaeon]|nr:HIT family protein [Nanoarchaeota archaeon]